MVSTRQPQGLLPTILTLIVLLQGVLANHGHQHVHRSKLEQIQERENILQKRANIAITGIKGSVYPRQEIRTLAKNADQWNLYLLGMQAFQAVSQSDPLSYYQIAGLSPSTGNRPSAADADIDKRYSRPAIRRMGWCSRNQPGWILSSRFHSFLALAQAIPCSFRGLCCEYHALRIN